MSRSPDPTTCARIRRMLHELALGRGNEAMQNEAGAHVSSCPTCRDVRDMAMKLTCQEISEFLDDVVEGRLTNAQQTVFDAHVALCPPCVDYVAGYKGCVQLAQNCNEESDPKMEMPAALVDAILAAKKAAEE